MVMSLVTALTLKAQHENMYLFICASMENCGFVYVFVSVELHSSCGGIMQIYCKPLAFTNPRLYTPHHCYELLRFLRYPSLSGAYEVIQHVLCLWLSLCCVFSVHACINVNCPPHRLLIYESYPGLSLLPPERRIYGPICRVCQRENRLMSTNIMNIVLTTCGLQHLTFR